MGQSNPKTAVYRFFNANDDLLYVGMSITLLARLHAQREEARAIREESPKLHHLKHRYGNRFDRKESSDD